MKHADGFNCTDTASIHCRVQGSLGREGNSPLKLLVFNFSYDSVNDFGFGKLKLHRFFSFPTEL